MAKTPNTNTIGTPYALYDLGAGAYPWSPVPPTPAIPVGSVSGLAAAISNATQGDIIEIVSPGVYNINTIVVGVPDITIRGHADAAPGDIILRGRGMDNAAHGGQVHGFYSEQAGLKLQNMTLEQFYQHAVTFGSGASRPIFEDLIIQDCGQQFIKASVWPSAINNGQVLGCTFRYTNGLPLTNQGAGYFYGGFIDVHSGANWVVRGNIAQEITPTQAEIDALPNGASYNAWTPAFYFWNGSSGTIIERNVFHNCARAVALGLMDRMTAQGFNDHAGGIVKNNLIAIDAGRLSAAQTASSDGTILLWDAPGAKALHNTVLTNGQVADAVQGRWSLGLEIANNLADNSIRMRDGAAYTGSNNVLSASTTWFVDPVNADLRLNSTGNSNVGTAARLIDVLMDVDGTARNNPTKIGAHVYG